MANTYSNLDNLFTAMANAIRLKNGGADSIVADTFPTEIRNLNTGFDYVNHEVTEINDYQFKNCTDLKSVDCYNLTSIGTGAFEGCSELEAVVIYDNVVNVGENAFKGCTSATIYCMFDSQPDSWNDNWNPDGYEVIYMSPVETWDISATEDDNVIAKLYNDVNNDGYYRLIINGSGKMKYWDRSHTPDHYPTYSPWKSYKSKILFLMVEDSVTNIGTEAFSNCTSLTSVIISDSVTNIGTEAFSNCTSLTSITISNNITNIYTGTFDRCSSLTSIDIPNGVTDIRFRAFRSCKSLESINIPDSVTIIQAYAFENCTTLESINYTGTVVQWSAIIKDSALNINTGSYTIYCTDGTIAKDGTITYYDAGGES